MHTSTPRPISPVTEYEWLPAGPFRALFLSLESRTGLPWRVVALAVGLPAPLASRLRTSLRRDRIRLHDARLLLAASPEGIKVACDVVVPARSSTRRLRRLLQRGMTLEEIAERTHLSRTRLRRLAEATTLHCPQGTAWALQAIEDEAERIPGATPTRVGRMTSPGPRAA